MKEIESNYWDDQSQRFLKIKLNTLFNSENKIICSKDGQILRMYQFSQQSDYLKDHVNNEEELNNLDQIKYLRWFGKQGEKNYKVGNWEAVWKDQILSDVGGYYSNNGQKQGIWTDLIKMYWSESQVYEVGEYENGIKVGRWKLLYDGQEIGGGSYNFQGNKDGKWFELSDNFWNKGQVMYYGEYFNGKKVGLWDILYKSKNDNNLLKFVGCGTYAQERKYDSIQINIKQGRWIEQSDQFWDEGQIIHSGVYKDGIKVGNWDTLYKSNKLNSNYELMGGGSYELKEGDNDFYDPIKSGSWIELSDGFRELNQIIYTGVYKNGKKTGYWDVLFKSIEANQFKKIGGGQYINKGQNDSVKDGDWIELSSKFNSFNQLTYNGKYRDGNKVDRWDAFFKQQGENYNFYFIGGGVYSSTIIDGATVKNGRWVEMSDSFWEYQQILQSRQSEVTLEGKYQYGIKVGIWKSYFKDIITKKKEQMQESYLLCLLTRGGGEYVIEQDGNSQKSGMWIELSVGFRWSDQITFNGQYLKGQKFGKWDMYNKKGGYQKSGGGSYDIKQANLVLSSSIKTGMWIELEDKFWHQSEILLVGQYINGLKVGEWKIQYKDVLAKKTSIIGGGQYIITKQNNGLEISIKSGVWIELAQEFTYNDQKVHFGEYVNGKKTGKWDKMDIKGKNIRKMQNQFLISNLVFKRFFSNYEQDRWKMNQLAVLIQKQFLYLLSHLQGYQLYIKYLKFLFLQPELVLFYFIVINHYQRAILLSYSSDYDQKN